MEETKMVEDQKEKGFVEGIEVSISTVELKVNRNNEEAIDKITFVTEKGDLTWKPKSSKTTFEGGFKVVKTVPMEKDLIPDIVSQIALTSNEKGKCKVRVAYNWWKTEQDGQAVTYRFITSAKTLEKWEILSDKTEVEDLTAIE